MESDGIISILHSEIDSLRFGINVAKISDPHLLSIDTISLLRQKNYDLIIARIDARDIQLLNRAEDFGFRVKDVQLTYKFDYTSKSINKDFLNRDIIIRDAVVKDANQLAYIAEECFWDYGHYFADKKLNPTDCIEVYKDWVVRALLEKNVAEKYFVAVVNDEIAGLIFFKTIITNNNKFSSCGVGAVAGKFRKQNVYSSLVYQGLLWGYSNNHEWQEHNILNNNFSVNSVLSKIGFNAYKSETTLHCWLK